MGCSLTGAVAPRPVFGGPEGLRVNGRAEREAVRTIVQSDAMLLAVAAGPLELDCVVAGLGRQRQLAAPAKLVLTRAGEPWLVAEVPAGEVRGNGDALVGCEEEARQTLQAALAWLRADAPEPPRRASDNHLGEAAAGSAAAATCAEIENGLGVLGWAWAKTAGHAYRVNVGQGGGPAPLCVEALPDAQVRISYPVTPVRAATAEAAGAVRLFALEANGRLRFARLSVTSGSADVLRVSWDAVVAASRCSEETLVQSLEAVVVARAETERALRALGATAVARAYLETWEHRARDGTSSSRGG